MSLLFLLAALRGAHKIRTYIDQVIGGDLLSVVVCDHCKHVSSMYIAISLVSVSICLSASVCVCLSFCGCAHSCVCVCVRRA